MPDSDTLPPALSVSPELLRLLTENEARFLTGDLELEEPWAELARAGADAETLRPLLHRTSLAGLTRLGDATRALQLNGEPAAAPLQELIHDALFAARIPPNTQVLQLLTWRASVQDGQHRSGLDPVRLAQVLSALLLTLPDTALAGLAKTLVQLGPSLNGEDRRAPLSGVLVTLHARLKRVADNPWAAEQRALAGRQT